MTKPTPLFMFDLIAAIIGLVLFVFTLWTIATLHNAAMDRQAEAILNPPMCITDTQQDIPCPKGEDQ